jgi:hypothetical protein
MRKACVAGLAAAALATVSLAPLGARGEPIRPSESHDDDWTLGLVGHSVPDVLKAAKRNPYAAPAAPACETIPREIAALDAVLGPDADSPAERTRIRVRAEKLMFQGIRSMIPHRDVVRFVTGAQRRDKALNDAAMAGWARRGFLKGMEVNLGCAARAATDAAVPIPDVLPAATTQTAMLAAAAPPPAAAAAASAPASEATEPAADLAPASALAPSSTAPDAALSR